MRGPSMKVGDLVNYRTRRRAWGSARAAIRGEGNPGIVIRVDDSHRQSKVDVLFCKGMQLDIWDGHLEVINESR